MNAQELIDFEKRIADLYDAGELPYLVHLSGGNEEQLLGIFQDIHTGDYVFSTHRNHYHALLHGIPPDDLEAKIRAGKSMFVFDRKLNFFSSSIVAATPAIAAGVAWALKRKGSTQRVWCLVGDGAEDEGHFYEAARYVDGWDLPCTFIIEDNDRSVVATCLERRGEFRFAWPSCVRRYHYKATYPHGGSGSPGWLKFKREAEVVDPPENYKTGRDVFIDKAGYLDASRQAMEGMAAAGAIFIGYNARCGGRAYGTLKNVPDGNLLETPLAENLMMGLAMGMSLEGIRPVVFFERHEFAMNAMDAIVNTLDVIETISGGEYQMPVIIKAVAGSVKPFYAGLTHTRNLAAGIKALVSMPVYEPLNDKALLYAYREAWKSGRPAIVSERKDLY